MGYRTMWDGSEFKSYYCGLIYGLQGDELKSSNGYAQSHSSSYSSMSSHSTTCTTHFRGNGSCSRLGSPELVDGESLGARGLARPISLVDLVYRAIADLYEEEIVPSVHEIRRKLSRNHGLDIEAEKLLSLCSSDKRFEISRVPWCRENANGLQNRWAILIMNRPLTFYTNPVDPELLELLSKYLLFICSRRYNILAVPTSGPYESLGNGSVGLPGLCVEPPAEEDVDFVPLGNILRLGGRYLFAEHLKKNGPRLLRNLPMGTLSTLVQKLNELGLLVYSGNCLVPVVTSKWASTKFLMNLNKSFNNDFFAGFRARFESLFTGGARISLSTLPMVYRNAFGENLRHAEMGYLKLSDFIKKEIPSCTISVEGNSPVVSVRDPGTVYPELEMPNNPGTDERRMWELSQIDLNIPQTTLLFPLKITKS